VESGLVSAAPRRAAPKPVGLTGRSRLSSAGDAISALGRQMKRPLHPWQRQVADVATERTARGRWRYPIVTVSVPRQSGKTTLMALLCIHRCLSVPDGQVWYTAQSRMDAVLRWREMVKLLRRSDLLELLGTPRQAPASGWDYRVRGATGNEVVEFANGSQLRVFSPAQDSLHGSVTDLVVIDEARFFDEPTGRGLMAAVLPTMATRDGQLWIVSTAGGPESVFLADELDAGRRSLTAARARRCHAEWSIGVDVAGPDLLELVWAAHPAAGRAGGLRMAALADAFEEMPAWQFAHEYGNRWQTTEDVRLLPAAAWRRSTVVEFPVGRPVFGVDVARDRSSAAVVACVGGTVQLVEHRPFADWVPARVLELVGQWDPAGVVVDAVESRTVETLRMHLGELLTAVSTRELTGACAGFYDAMLADPPAVRHTPSEILDDAVERAERRSLGQSWVFARAASGPALLAMVLAWWGGTRAVDVAEESQIWV
jgi:hypothetical protein